MKTLITNFTILVFAVCLLPTCGTKDKKTTMKIIDPERHYQSVLRGQTLDILYEIENSGEYPLFIEDIKTSCGCVVIDEASFKKLPSGGKGFIKIKYDSSKSIGYAKHYITIYANLKSGDSKEITFDLYVEPNALYAEDNEKSYNKQIVENRGMKTSVNNYENNKLYHTGKVPYTE